MNQVGSASLNDRASVEWVNLTEIMPNPLNPRKNDAIKTEEMQEIIKKRGWEEPLTVYRKGKMFVLLSGHRRLFAARESKIRQVPVYIVEAPKSHQDEIERIASLQSGREDWTSFEWARFTYERWIAWGQPKISKFAKEINLASSTVENYIMVIGYFPIPEIESGLRTRQYNLTVLYELVRWIRVLTKAQPELVQSLTEEMIRKVMLDKASERLIDRDSLRQTEFLHIVAPNVIRDFILSKKEKLSDLLLKNEIDTKKKTFHGSLISMGILEKTVKQINPRTNEQRKKAAEKLMVLKSEIEKQLLKLSSVEE